jgi:hypothetical protein
VDVLGVASRHPAGGWCPWKAMYCSSEKRSSTVPGRPGPSVEFSMAARRSRCRRCSGSRLYVADARLAAVEALLAAAHAAEHMGVADLDFFHRCSLVVSTR